MVHDINMPLEVIVVDTSISILVVIYHINVIHIVVVLVDTTITILVIGYCIKCFTQ